MWLGASRLQRLVGRLVNKPWQVPALLGLWGMRFGNQRYLNEIFSYNLFGWIKSTTMTFFSLK